MPARAGAPARSAAGAILARYWTLFVIDLGTVTGQRGSVVVGLAHIQANKQRILVKIDAVITCPFISCVSST